MSSSILLKKKILIFGALGQLGHDLVNEFSNNYQVIGLDRKEADITDNKAVIDIIQKNKPDIIINAAAYTKVEDSELNPQTAYEVNALGSFYLAKAAESLKSKFVLISTDYVFDGVKRSYNEKDCPNPINVYGASKLSGEQLAMIACSNFLIIRTSALFGNQCSKQKLNFVDLMLKLANSQKEIRVVNDQYTKPTYTIDLSKKIKELIDKSAPSGIYHITNNGCCSWFDYAKEIIYCKGLTTKVVAIKTKESNTRIKRPKSPILNNGAIKKINLEILPSWRNALRRYLKIN